MIETMRIDRRFSGPTDLGNGGYAAGLLARSITGSAEVTLHRPLPLDRPLAVEHTPAGLVLLKEGAEILAEARPAPLDLEIPPPPDLATASAASENYIGFHNHPFPGCFVCGPTRAKNDGLRIFAGALADSNRVAAPWVPGRSLADKNGLIAAEYIWAALDCPGYFAIAGVQPVMALLGRMTTAILQPVRSGSHNIVVGWEIGRQGRKRYAGTAVFTPTGTLVAKAQATWIEITTPK